MSLIFRTGCRRGRVRRRGLTLRGERTTPVGRADVTEPRRGALAAAPRSGSGPTRTEKHAGPPIPDLQAQPRGEVGGESGGQWIAMVAGVASDFAFDCSHSTSVRVPRKNSGSDASLAETSANESPSALLSSLAAPALNCGSICKTLSPLSSSVLLIGSGGYPSPSSSLLPHEGQLIERYQRSLPRRADWPIRITPSLPQVGHG